MVTFGQVDGEASSAIDKPLDACLKMWSLDNVKSWIEGLESDSDISAIGFCALRRWLVESVGEKECHAAIRLTEQLLDKLELAIGLPSKFQSNDVDWLASIFAMLATIAVEAGPYRFESKPVGSSHWTQGALKQMTTLRVRAVDLLKEYFGRTEFAELGPTVAEEVFPLLEGMVEEFNGEMDRYFPFRVVQATKMADKLWELGQRVEAEIMGAAGNTRLADLLDALHSMKYPRFGTSGLRGRWDIDFVREKVSHVVEAICDFLQDRAMPPYVQPVAIDLTGKWIVIGYDGRRHSKEVAQWVAEVCLCRGFRVYLATRATPTPVLIHYSTIHLGKDRTAGILNCTASHNPPDWQGIKFNPREGYPAPTHLTDIVAARANEKQLLQAPVLTYELEKARADGYLVDFDPLPRYCAWVRSAGEGDSRIRLDWHSMREYFKNKKVVIDEMHGAGRGFLPRILSELQIPYEVIHGDANPDLRGLKYPYASPEPPYIWELQRRVKDAQAELGIGLDMDADRFGIVGPEGEYFRPNRILAMLTKYLGVDKGLQGRVVITQTGLPMIERIAAHVPEGAKFKPNPGSLPAYVDHPFYKRRIGFGEDLAWRHIFVVPVGIKYIVEIPRMDRAYRLLEDESLPAGWMDELLIGGEESSGLTTKGHVPDKDGIWANLLVMDMIAYYGKSLPEIWGDLVEFDDCWDSSGGRVDVDASDEAKENLINYYLDAFKGESAGSVAIAGAPVMYLGGTRYDFVGIFLGERPGRSRHFLRIRASGTEPLIRIYTESAGSDLQKALERAVLNRLDRFSAAVIRDAPSPWGLADVLAVTYWRQESSVDLHGEVVQKISKEAWTPKRVVELLRRKRSRVEARNVPIVDHWIDWLLKL